MDTEHWRSADEDGELMSGPAKIVIFGQYKTGTTGVFYKIRNSLDGPVRELFECNEYVSSAEDSRRWILAKTMLVYNGPIQYRTFMDFQKKLYIIRDPRDWAVSAALFLIQQEPSIYADSKKMGVILDLLRRKETDPASSPLLEIFRRILTLSNRHSFEETFRHISRQYRWLPEFERRLSGHHVVKYEDFVDGRIRALQDYLDIPLTGNSTVAKVHDHVIRTRSHGNWRQWFCEEDVAFFRPIFRSYMERHGYEDDWELDSDPSIPEEFCSQYVERTVEKRRSRH